MCAKDYLRINEISIFENTVNAISIASNSHLKQGWRHKFLLPSTLHIQQGSWLAVRLTGNSIVHTNTVILHPAQTVLRRVIIYGHTIFVCNQPTQPPTLSGTGNEYQPKCCDALRLGSKGRYSLFHLWINVWVAGKTVIPR